MSDAQPPVPPSAACAEDRERLRELWEALARERQARAGLEAASDETRRTLHALNNALSIVATFAATLGDELEEGAARESVDEIVKAARRAGELSRKLGDVLRKVQGLEGPPQGRT
jgi:hypothetical protein